MKQLIIIEFKNCIRSKKFQMTFSVMYLLSLISFFINCERYYGYHLSSVRSAHQVDIIRSLASRTIIDLLIIALPLVAFMINSDSFFRDYNTGVYKNIITRVNKKSYLLVKVLVTFILTFLTFFLTLTLNELLTLIAFPLKGYDNNSAYPSYDIGYSNYTSTDFLDLTRLNSPYLYNIAHIVIISLIAALFAVLILSLSFLMKAKILQIVLGVFSFYTLSDIIFFVLKAEKFSVKNYLYASKTGTPDCLFGWILILTLLPIILYIIAKKDEIDI